MAHSSQPEERAGWYANSPSLFFVVTLGGMLTDV